MSEKRRNYWPHAIILAILAVMGLGVWTINIASKNPVYMDEAYMSDYRNVDEHINELIAKEKAFDAKYLLTVEPKAFKIGTNSVTVHITDKKGGNAVDDANITLVVTRPDTNRYDKKPALVSVKDGLYTFAPFKIKRLGRWQILTKVILADTEAFKKNEVNATR